MHCVTHTIVLWDYTHTHTRKRVLAQDGDQFIGMKPDVSMKRAEIWYIHFNFFPACYQMHYVCPFRGYIFFFFFSHEKGSFQGQRGREWQVIRITVQPYQVTPSITLICQDCNKIGLGRGKVNILIRHVSVSTVHKLTREFIEECGRGGRGGRG